MKRVVVVGAGVTGLSAAWGLVRAVRALGLPLEVRVVERERRVGGKVLTERVDGFVVDAGPDSLFYVRPWARALPQRLGLEADLVDQDPHHRTVFLLKGGRLQPLPASFLALAPSRPAEFLKAPLSWRARLRGAVEAFLPPRKGGGDESIASFVRRRFGRAFLEELAEPLMAGIHGGVAEELSMAALYPQMLEMERKKGSVVRAMAAYLGSRSGRGSAFRSFRGGMGRVVEALAEEVGPERILLGREVRSLGRAPSVWEVEFAGEVLEADAVVLALPAFLARPLLGGVRPSLASLLGEQAYAPAVSLVYAFRRSDVSFSLEGSGYLAPRAERTFLGGCSWLSQKWPGRAPEGTVLLRAYAGRVGQEEVLSFPPEELLRRGLEELRVVLGLRGEPLLSRAYLWPRAMPQYRVGHLEWVEAVEREVGYLPGLYLAGASYRGVGVPECFGQGLAAARSVLECLFPGSAEGLEGLFEP